MKVLHNILEENMVVLGDLHVERRMTEITQNSMWQRNDRSCTHTQTGGRIYNHINDIISYHVDSNIISTRQNNGIDVSWHLT